MKKAYAVGLKHWPVDMFGITAAESAGRARYVVYLQVRDIGWPYEITDLRALRIPALDDWAAEGPRGHWGADHIAEPVNDQEAHVPRTSSDRPVMNRRPIILGLAFSFMLVAVVLAGVLAGKAYGREGGQVTPTLIPATAGGHARVHARAVCPNDSSIPACRAALRRAYTAIAWQKHARAMTVRDITRDAIAWAAAKYHVSASDMTSVGACESHLWPFATNGQYEGAWQLSARHRSDPIFRLVPWQDAYAQASHVARYVKAHGWGEWQCQPGGGLRW